MLERLWKGSGQARTGRTSAGLSERGCWTGGERALDRPREGAGQAERGCWTGGERALDRPREGAGQAERGRWTGRERVLDRPRAGAGQAESGCWTVRERVLDRPREGAGQAESRKGHTLSGQRVNAGRAKKGAERALNARADPRWKRGQTGSSQRF